MTIIMKVILLFLVILLVIILLKILMKILLVHMVLKHFFLLLKIILLAIMTILAIVGLMVLKEHILETTCFGSIGTPIVAVESGIIEHLGWNQYGGWRVGIRSFDQKRYYYYAHLRKNHPYVNGLEEGMSVKAGDVIGYLGMTGYSIKENVNNINIPHLHFGMQLIFDDSQVDSPNEIWIDVYNIIEFLMQNRSEVYMSNKETKDYSRKFDFIDDDNNE